MEKIYILTSKLAQSVFKAFKACWISEYPMNLMDTACFIAYPKKKFKCWHSIWSPLVIEAETIFLYNGLKKEIYSMLSLVYFASTRGEEVMIQQGGEDKRLTEQVMNPCFINTHQLIKSMQSNRLTTEKQKKLCQISLWSKKKYWWCLATGVFSPLFLWLPHYLWPLLS